MVSGAAWRYASHRSAEQTAAMIPEPTGPARPALRRRGLTEWPQPFHDSDLPDYHPLRRPAVALLEEPPTHVTADAPSTPGALTRPVPAAGSGLLRYPEARSSHGAPSPRERSPDGSYAIAASRAARVLT